MSKPVPVIAVLLGALSALVAGPAGSCRAAETYELDNGMTVILKEQHGAPMVSSIVFVRSGSKYESRFENGITYFLEHLLFDGTATLAREQLDASIGDLGGYINAFTRKELTAYLVLLPKQYIEYGMTVQADMLFNSVFPEAELAKERKVVVEEIRRDADAPGAAAEAFFTDRAYAGTDYARPVLGYPAFIENIPRAAVIDYWRRYYIPRRMTLLVIGDFEPAAMKKTVANVFGRFTNPASAADSAASASPAPAPVLEGQTIYDTAAQVPSTYLNLSLAAPPIGSAEYYAMDLLARYLAMDAVSPLMVALKGGAEPLATEASVSLVPYEEFSRLEISVITEHPERRDSIITVIFANLAAMARHAADPGSIAGLQTSVQTDDIYSEAKLHYYGFMIAPYLMTAGWDFVQTYAEKMAAVTWADCNAAADRWLARPAYIGTVVRPATDSAAAPYRPEEMSADEVLAHFAEATFPEHELVAGHTITYPPTDSISFTLTDRASYRREQLPNGMTVIVKTVPDNEVFALMVLGRNRSANEPPGRAGITEFVNRCLERGTATRSAKELADALAGIGAQVTLYDNPWIPYDDRYTARAFSFLKFETIEAFARKGFALFSEVAFSPAFDSAEVENVRQAMIGVLRRQGTSPREAARDLFYTTLFEGSAYARPIMGDFESLNAITVDDLRAHHRRIYAPENTIIAVVTSRPADEILGWFAEGPGRFAPTGFVSAVPAPPQPVRQIIAAQVPLEKEQVAIYLGGPTPGAESPDALALEMAAGILSNRLYLNLREKQGLAYSVGAGADADRGFGWCYASMQTGVDNYRQAVGGILLEMDKLRYDGPLASEVRRARNEIWGRLMSAKLSAINQAFYLAVDEFLGRPLPYDRTLLDRLGAIDREGVRRVAAQYFRTDAYVIATAGRTPAETAPPAPGE